MKNKLTKSVGIILCFVMLFCFSCGSAAFAEEPGDEPQTPQETELKNGWSDDKTMYFVDDVAVTGFRNIDGRRYYFNPKTAVKVTGLKKIDNFYYLFTDGGAMRYGWKNYNNARYYFNLKSGKGAVGLKRIDDNYYLFGTNAKMKKGWQTVDGKKYYFSPKSGKAPSGLKKIGKYYYCFSSKGMMRYGWKNLNDHRYYFDGKTGRAVRGLKKIKGGYYYFDSKSRMQSGWQNVKGATYYFRTGGKYYGKAVTGKVYIGYRYYHFAKNGKLIPDRELMRRKAQKYSSGTNYLILVNKTTHKVGVFKKSKSKWKMQKYYTCTIGAGDTPTPSGTFTMGPNGSKPFHQRYFDSGKVRCWYASRITGNYHFHSVLYTQTPAPTTIAYGQLGANMSHGCIRLEIGNAHWIYNNIPAGTKCVIYS